MGDLVRIELRPYGRSIDIERGPTASPDGGGGKTCRASGDSESSCCGSGAICESEDIVKKVVRECVMDHGYRSGPNLLDLEEVGIRSYIAEPDCGRRKWKAKGEKGEEKAKEQKVVYSRIFEPSLLLDQEEKLW